MSTEIALALNNLTAAVTYFGDAVNHFTLAVFAVIVFCCCTLVYIARNINL